MIKFKVSICRYGDDILIIGHKNNKISILNWINWSNFSKWPKFNIVAGYLILINRKFIVHPKILGKFLGHVN